MCIYIYINKQIYIYILYPPTLAGSKGDGAREKDVTLYNSNNDHNNGNNDNKDNNDKNYTSRSSSSQQPAANSQQPVPSYISHFLGAILMRLRLSLPWCFPIREVSLEQQQQQQEEK